MLSTSLMQNFGKIASPVRLKGRFWQIQRQLLLFSSSKLFGIVNILNVVLEHIVIQHNV